MGYNFFKRLLDLMLGIVLLCLSLPIVLLFCVLIPLESRGSPLFIQERVGLKGRTFKLYKLRGMYTDSRLRYPALYDFSDRDSLEFYYHVEKDPRITRIGHLIRRTSIDELPNFLNVLFGNMSLVGPRPEIPEVFSLYRSMGDEYVSVKPGITCLSKCDGRDSLTKSQALNLDLDYVRNKSFLLDVKIIIKTALNVLGCKNVY